jgi:hypothetical protein
MTDLFHLAYVLQVHPGGEHDRISFFKVELHFLLSFSFFLFLHSILSFYFCFVGLGFFFFFFLGSSGF